MVTISYFAWVREQMRCSQEVVVLPESVSDIASLIDWLARRDAQGAVAFADASRIRAAVDDVMADMLTSLNGAREIALFPPVTGG